MLRRKHGRRSHRGEQRPRQFYSEPTSRKVDQEKDLCQDQVLKRFDLKKTFPDSITAGVLFPRPLLENVINLREISAAMLADSRYILYYKVCSSVFRFLNQIWTLELIFIK